MRVCLSLIDDERLDYNTHKTSIPQKKCVCVCFGDIHDDEVYSKTIVNVNVNIDIDIDIDSNGIQCPSSSHTPTATATEKKHDDAQQYHNPVLHDTVSSDASQ